MPASVSRPFSQPERFGRLWWLPSNGAGNGLDDAAWAPLAVVPAAVVSAVLTEFRAAKVPGYAAPVATPLRRQHRGRRDRTPEEPEPSYQVWVGTSGYSQAEEILRTALPAFLANGRS